MYYFMKVYLAKILSRLACAGGGNETKPGEVVLSDILLSHTQLTPLTIHAILYSTLS